MRKRTYTVIRNGETLGTIEIGDSHETLGAYCTSVRASLLRGGYLARGQRIMLHNRPQGPGMTVTTEDSTARPAPGTIGPVGEPLPVRILLDLIPGGRT